MATYTHSEVAGSPTTYWGDIDVSFVSATGTLIVLTNTDGSQTRLSGTGFTFTGSGSSIVLTGGTISSIARTNVGGGITYEQITGINYSATAFQSHINEPNLNGVMQDVFSGNDTFTGFSGNDIIKGFSGSDTLNGGAGNDTLIAGTAALAVNVLNGGLGADVLIGGAGFDYAAYWNATSGVTVSLLNPAGNTGEAAGDTYTSIDGLIGSAFNDTLTGNNGFNWLVGGAGADTLDGQGGTDYAAYWTSSGPVTASLANPASNTGDAAGDTYISIEGLVGSRFNDTLIGDANNNFLIGGPGADSLNGGAGFDYASYLYSPGTVGVTASLANPAINTGDAAGDSYTSIEGLIGTNFNDTLIGDGSNNSLVGGLGADVLNGGGGFDFAAYFAAGTGVTVNLSNPASNSGEAAGDTFISIEGIIGSAFNDTLTGDGGNNVFRGQGGADVINGGAGTDIADYSTATASITATLAATSTVSGNASVGTDTLISVEGVRGTNFADSFTATTSFNGSSGAFVEFEGMGGNDTISGNGTTRVSFSLALSGVTVNLLAGTAQSTAAGDAAGIGIDSFAGTIGPDHINSVNAVRGSDFADTITAAGARGNFQFIGLRGNDTFVGSAEAINNFDSNLARYDIISNTPGTVNNGIHVVLDTVSTVTDLAGGNAVGTDTLVNVERVRGTNLADTFTANAGFSGPFGTTNRFEGMGGNDTITGNGHTHVMYRQALAGVTVNLQSGTAQSTAGGDAAGIGVDTITGGVNNVNGSDFNDTIIGSNGAQAESFYGGGGNDSIDGGGGLLNRVSYQGDPNAVTVNLASHSATDGFGGTDTLSNIQGATGSEFNDVITGDANDNRLQGQSGDDQLIGGGGNDFLVGDDGVDLYSGAFGTFTPFDSGNDVLDGGVGADQMWGGKGNDTYYVDNASDKVNEAAGAGSDTVFASVNYALQAGQEVEFLRANAGGTGLTLTGNEFNNSLFGGAGNDTLNGGNGNDTLNGLAGADIMSGGAGNDTYYVDNASDKVNEAAGAGSDTVYASVNYALQAGQEVEFLRANAGATGLTLIGNEFNNSLFGGAGNDTLNGGNGNDVLNGGAGADIMSGGAGNDTYYVDNASDKVNEAAGAGSDTVYASLSYALQAGQEVEFLRANAGATGLTLTGNEFNNTVVGGTGSDTLNGGNGNDTLNGLAGADIMSGGAGNDTYYVDNASDKVNEAAGAGSDTVYASVNYALQAGQEVEFLRANAGATGLTLIGNEFNNSLFGGAGNDTLNGGNGNDVLNGGAGADIMSGGAGNDTYYVDNASDKVNEAAGAGSDTVYASLSYALQAGQEVEFLRANAGATGLTLTGNEFNNTLVGGTGSDTLNGGAGNDTLNGGAGNDALNGGAGNDTYYVDNASDKVNEAAGAGSDTVYASLSYALQAGQEVEFLRANAGATGLTLTGNEFNNTVVGGTGSDTLNGGAGNDTLNGGAGNDALNGGAGNDTLICGAGVDRIAFNTALNAALNVDHIVDFTPVDDTMLLENSIFTALTTAGTLAANAFFAGAGANTAHDADDRIVYNTTTGGLFYDADGMGGAAAIQFAVLDTHPAITNADFQVV